MTTDDTVSTGNGFDTRPRYGIGECDCCGGAHFTGSCHVDVARHAALVAALHWQCPRHGSDLEGLCDICQRVAFRIARAALASDEGA